MVVEPVGRLLLELAAAALAVLGEPVEGYGKAALVGLAFTNRGRLNAGLGGLKEQVIGRRL